MEIEGGDSIVFGPTWCIANNRDDLKGKTVKLEPQWFECDNGLYVYHQVCAGLPAIDEDEIPDSIYHLFGNDLESFLDCTLIKGSKEDYENYRRKCEAAQFDFR